jgi:hypothetical protein
VKLNWYQDLYRIGSVSDIGAVTLRVTLAVGIPLIGGMWIGHSGAAIAGGYTALFVTLCDVGETMRVRLGWMGIGWLMILFGAALGHSLGSTPCSREIVVVLCALLAGWASGSHPGVAVVTRFFAIAAAVASSMHFADPDVLLSVLIGGAGALACAVLTWEVFGISVDENLMDWRAGVRRALRGTGAGPRFALCYAVAAGVALFAASALRVHDAFWATMVVLMVMRREGIACLELTIQYALGTILGVLAAGLLVHIMETPFELAITATAIAAFIRVGFSINPALGYLTFTVFVILGVDMNVGGRIPAHLLTTRLYDVSVGCGLAVLGTIAASHPRTKPPWPLHAGGASANEDLT